jgi:hypothetical protein
MCQELIIEHMQFMLPYSPTVQDWIHNSVGLTLIVFFS